MSELPELPLEQWKPTKETLHLWLQIVGKVRLAATAPQNHWWNAPLYVDARGLTTRALRSGELEFDVFPSAPAWTASRGRRIPTR